MSKRKKFKEFNIFVGGRPTDIDKFIYSEKVYTSKQQAIKRAQELRENFKSPVILEEWRFTFVKPCSLYNGLSKGEVISFSVPELKEAA